ncbi:hypothetical protein L6452_03530 [Arctium lappa]|uniref:Uncharacterized protein n=1 Tax=Arctium lappa TaxID=4217 RepID=A0ACB9FNP4_ARCLA|nr:hypothetical protein L6452_03530 [Arctium lappa]
MNLYRHVLKQPRVCKSISSRATPQQKAKAYPFSLPLLSLSFSQWIPTCSGLRWPSPSIDRNFSPKILEAFESDLFSFSF